MFASVPIAWGTYFICLIVTATRENTFICTVAGRDTQAWLLTLLGQATITGKLWGFDRLLWGQGHRRSLSVPWCRMDEGG